MPDVSALSVHSYNVPLVSPKRQDAIDAARSAVDFKNEQSVAEARRQITHMGALDWLCDRFCHNGDKARALEALATLILFKLADAQQQSDESLLGNRQGAYIMLAQCLSESGKARLLEADDKNERHNDFAKFLSEADWHSLVAQVRFNDAGKCARAARQTSYAKAAASFMAAAAVHANEGRWARAAEERWCAATLYQVEAGLYQEAAKAFEQVAREYANADRGGWTIPSQKVKNACREAANSWQCVADNFPSAAQAELRKEAYEKAVKAYADAGLFANAAHIHRLIAADHEGAARDELIAADKRAAQDELAVYAYRLAAYAEESGGDYCAAAKDYSKAAAALLRILDVTRDEGDKRHLRVRLADMYFEVAEAHAEVQEHIPAAAAAMAAADLYDGVDRRFKCADASMMAGAAHVKANDPKQGAIHLLRAANIYEALGVDSSAGEAFTAAGSALLKAGEPDEAIEAHEQAAKIYRNNGMRVEAEAAAGTAKWIAAERIKEKAEAERVAATLLDLEGFKRQYPPDHARDAEIHAKIAAHLTALASQPGLDADGRSLRMDGKADNFSGTDFDAGQVQVWFLLRRSEYMWDIVTAATIELILTHISPEDQDQGKEPKRLNPYLRCPMQVGHVCGGEALLALLSKVSAPEEGKAVPSQ